MKTTVKITSDHAGYDAKINLAKRLENEGYNVELFGSKTNNNSDSYADAAIELVNEIHKDGNPDENKNVKYVAFCGSGIGIEMTLNKFKGIRAARVTNENESHLAKLHNNANVLCMGGRLLEGNEVEKIFHSWENTEFEGGRHLERIKKLSSIGEN
ncbi:RpiB/LacA/LacB family sugar-phosphate isomerase [Metamycoplasma hominis]|uniref:Ribose-5-phosphate isomerase n=2 Tax=Metamycoplasma hominis TaxID=2098 RepID=D1J8H6_METH1|nr:RpiB/LacA/LacB family sugar-phosphate isomerase [Metamycoplasma hominis]AAO39418.2 ribose-5-phosphate isomerase [Metamycoplasma hominis ATCC 23114]AIU34163.1 putative ribose-5-phosphate isomerase B [Metamycoplasma hominis ATCC 27545]AKJ52669.1 putative ribose-5-phosphate isomerase B [Metamycoplasma hominis]AYN65539.1 RpiB/LacA/LacB family sugar-phosphate isomerase [Metamycoplasma hominis]KGF61816.1 ribose 5-phosphate isomerase [Metamycoplasma hominis]